MFQWHLGAFFAAWLIHEIYSHLFSKLSGSTDKLLVNWSFSMTSRCEGAFYDELSFTNGALNSRAV